MNAPMLAPVQNITTWFRFENDFVEDNVRCIPMAVRFKLDLAGIKLQLSEWSRFTPVERNRLLRQACHTQQEILSYRFYLAQLIRERAGHAATLLQTQPTAAWADENRVDRALQQKAHAHGWHITLEQWLGLTVLQRFALMKLSLPGHEGKNFPKAMQEFRLIATVDGSTNNAPHEG